MATENLIIFSARPRAILRVPLIPEFLKRIPNTFLVEQLVCPSFNELTPKNCIVMKDSWHDQDNAFEKSDILAFLVAHDEFKNHPVREDQIVLDFCGING